jgi:hypothetical protein
MNQWWLLFKIVALSFVPLPVNPKLTRPDANKNFWTFECDGFTSGFHVAKVFYTDTLAAQYLVEKSD